MHYTQLHPSYKYDTIAGAIHAREVEYFHYEFDLINFGHIVATESEGAYRQQLQKNMAEIEEHMRRVSGVIDALKAQIDDPAAYAAAVQRATEKRNAAS